MVSLISSLPQWVLGGNLRVSTHRCVLLLRSCGAQKDSGAQDVLVGQRCLAALFSYLSMALWMCGHTEAADSSARAVNTELHLQMKDERKDRIERSLCVGRHDS